VRLSNTIPIGKILMNSNVNSTRSPFTMDNHMSANDHFVKNLQKLKKLVMIWEKNRRQALAKYINLVEKELEGLYV
jgi:hypothetical protein